MDNGTSYLCRKKKMQLFLNTYGTYLHVKDELFEIRLPQEGKTVAKHFAATKVTAIFMTTAAALSTDAVALALRYNIDIVFLSRGGSPLGRIWHSKLGSTTRIRKRQLEASLGIEGVYWTIEWLCAKLEAQADLLESLKKHRKPMRQLLDERVAKIKNLRESIAMQGEAVTVDAIADTLRGLEGTAGRLYFSTLSACLPEAQRFEGRSFRPAADPFNAFLNYGYGILYARIEKCLMVAGIDPYVGFMHRDDYNQKSMVFDFIEPYRPLVDKVVFRFFSRKLVNQEHTQAITGGFSLAKPGKEMLIEALNDYLEVEAIRYKGRNQTRMNCIQQDAHHVAQSLIGKASADPVKSTKL